MNTKVLGGIVLAVIVIGGGWYLLAHPGSKSAGEQGTMEQKDMAENAHFADLLALGGSQICDVSITSEDTPATGTVYIADGKFRSDVVATPKAMNGGSVSGHVLKTDEYVYAWSDLSSTGIKVKIDAVEDTGKNAGYDPEAPVSYSCKAWVMDPAKFTVPADISFIEPAAMMPQPH